MDVDTSKDNVWALFTFSSIHDGRVQAEGYFLTNFNIDWNVITDFITEWDF